MAHHLCSQRRSADSTATELESTATGCELKKRRSRGKGIYSRLDQGEEEQGRGTPLGAAEQGRCMSPASRDVVTGERRLAAGGCLAPNGGRAVAKMRREDGSLSAVSVPAGPRKQRTCDLIMGWAVSTTLTRRHVSASIGPMRFIDKPSRFKSEEDYPWLSTAVNFLSIKIASSDVGFPIRVYGTIIARDHIDDWKCVYHFRRDSNNCQLINSEDESLILSGPKRGLVLCQDIYVEIDLKMKDDQVQDREVSKGVINIRSTSTGPTVSGYKFQTKSLATRLSTVDVNYTVVYQALEATIAVEVLQGGFHGKIVAYTANMKYMLVLYDSFKEADAMTVDDCEVLELMRPVVSVSIKDLLVIEALTSDESARIVFSPRINARDERQLAVGATKLCVKLSWSVLD